MTKSIDITQFKLELEKVRLRRHQMIIITGGKRSEAVKQISVATGIEPLNIGLKLSELLLELPVNRRNRKVGELVNLLLMQSGDLVILEHIELLFLPELQVDPMRLFEDLSRSRVLIVDWNGKYDNGVLSYAYLGHPEYRIYHEIEASIIQTNYMGVAGDEIS